MSLGPVMLDLSGTSISPIEREMLMHPQTGGVILFTRNFESMQQLEVLVNELHELRDPHLIVAVDHEGGRVQRFREGFTVLPPANRFGQLYDQDKKHARVVTEQLGWLMAVELRAMNVDISFAPVLDIAHGVSGVIGDRAFHHSPEALADLTHEYMRGMRRAGMAATGKHFPGHGGVKEDSHIAKPVDERKLEDLMMADMLPFERMIHYDMAGIMPAHVVYPAVDSKPAGFSTVWLKDILRQQLGFQGVIFSDDLSMDAADLDNSFADRAHLALEAGCDMVLVCNHPEGAEEVLTALEGYKNPASQMRLIRLHGKNNITWDALKNSREWIDAVSMAKLLCDNISTLEMNI